MNDNNDEHDAAQCDDLHVLVDFTIRGYGISKGSLELEKWFKTVLTATYPAVAEMFDVGPATDPNTNNPALEITQHNPYFSIDALEQLFYSWKESQVKTQSKLNIVKNENMN